MRIEELSIPDPVKNAVIKSGITSLFPPQKDAIEIGVLNGNNLVLASPTASGKTLIAELCALKHILERDGKTLYLTPLRALANEKYMDFRKYSRIKKNGRRIRIGISTGDFDSTDPWLGNFDIIISTNEKADSLLRHNAKWIKDISLIVVDEIHLLNDAKRGPTLEIVLARLMKMNPKLQILALSATIRNTEEIADWLEAKIVDTDWRPVKLREGVYLDNQVLFKDNSTLVLKSRTKDAAINLALHQINLGEQVLIFGGTRRNTVSLARKAANKVTKTLNASLKKALTKISESILSSGVRTSISEQLAEFTKRGAAFHHAGLSGDHRKIIENAFREKKLMFLAATPTLALGVNLPARMVIINNYRRYEPGYGYFPISVLEYKQMAGRAGRPRYDEIGDALLVAKNDLERDYLMENFVNSFPEKIWSKLAVEPILRSHVLATISSEFVETEDDVYEFFKKTFFAMQYGENAIHGKISSTMNYLFDEGMIKKNSAEVKSTRYGRRVSELYIDPVSGVFIREALLKRADNLTNLSFLHMIAHTPNMFPRLRAYQKEIESLGLYVEEHRSEFMFEPPNEWMDWISVQQFLGEAKLAQVLGFWIEETSENDIFNNLMVQPGDLYRLVETSKWLLHASYELALLLGHKDLLTQLKILNERIGSGVKEELLPFVQLNGIGRVRARILYNSGLKSLKDLKSLPMDRLTNLPLIGPKLAKRVKEQIGGMIKKKDWERMNKGRDWEQKKLFKI